jgi:hypothetical protein
MQFIGHTIDVLTARFPNAQTTPTNVLEQNGKRSQKLHFVTSVVQQRGPNHPPFKGALKPIRSGRFLAQVEVDLISMRPTAPGNGRTSPLTCVFDAIYWTHYRCAHGKVSPTHKHLQLTYWNKTEREVKNFISLRPSCNKEGPTIPPESNTAFH